MGQGLSYVPVAVGADVDVDIDVTLTQSRIEVLVDEWIRLEHQPSPTHFRTDGVTKTAFNPMARWLIELFVNTSRRAQAARSRNHIVDGIVRDLNLDHHRHDVLHARFRTAYLAAAEAGLHYVDLREVCIDAVVDALAEDE